MTKIFVAASLAAVASACATAPGNITAQYVSPLQYQNFSCDQMASESQRIGARLSQVTGQQQSKADSDAVAMGVGMVLFWPALFFLGSGANQTEELSRLKGESDALQQAAIQKNCMSRPAQTSDLRQLAPGSGYRLTGR
jgi:hypothetical protein